VISRLQLRRINNEAANLEIIMSYKTLMVHLHMGHSNTAILQATRAVAENFKTEVIGIVVGQQTQMIYGRGYAAMDFFDREDAQIEKKIAEAEVLFRDAFKGFSGAIEWRSAITREPMTDYIVSEVRSADMIITGVSPSDFYEGPAAVNAGEIVMRSGRPVLTVPVAAEKFVMDSILVGWKDTREARRAIVDALPLLKQAKQVCVVEIAVEAEQSIANKRLYDVVNWLKSHDVAADCIVLPSTGDDAVQFVSVAKQRKANLIVAGAYGHSRLREWVLGGVTNELLQNADFCTLLSH
jgi:nucleotide-binding universal stress UspA family protein